MEECNIGLGGNFNKICGYKPKQGIKRKWYGNESDIDKEATVMANRGNKITTLVLKAGAKIYPVKGNDKTNQLQASGVVGDYGNGFTHTDTVNILYRGANERERVQEIVDGARIFSIVEKVDGGENGELTYEVAGFESGMLMSSFEYDSNANSGVATLAVATKEGEEEGTAPKLFLDTDVATTQAWIDANSYDSAAPTTPTNVGSTAVTANSVDLSWTASTDDVGVTGYKVYKDGVLDQTVATTTATISGLTASTQYAFTVSAIDAAGNESAQSTAFNVTTSA